MTVRNTTQYILGIDEAGRGPLAGPVVVAGVRIRARGRAQNAKLFEGIRDSKKLSPIQREQWYGLLTRHPAVEWAVARVSHAVIDRINIRNAALLGARRVYAKLIPAYAGISLAGQGARGGAPPRARALLDGGLFLPHQTNVAQKTVIKGDEKIPLIAAASIIAKVTRDRLMLRLHKKYPQYGFDRHKGYGTVLHREMIAEFGQCEIHRKSFWIDR
ncbi:MAG: ribonuclease HII [Patescibacteria group bacterium]